MRESLGVPILPAAAQPAHAVVLAREAQSLALAGRGPGSEERLEFDLVLTRPALAVAQQQLLQVG